LIDGDTSIKWQSSNPAFKFPSYHNYNAEIAGFAAKWNCSTYHTYNAEIAGFAAKRCQTELQHSNERIEPMDMLENLSLALVSLKANRMRTLLTLLGIVIGIASVIGIITVGSAMTDSITGSMQGMGANNITASVQQRSDDSEGNFMAGNGVVLPSGNDTGVQAVPSESDLITDQMIRDFTEGYPDQVENVSLSESVGSGQVKEDRDYANISITGTNSGYGAVNSITILNGRYVKDSDVSASRSVAVISDKLAERIFGTQDPIGEQIKIYLGEQIYTYAVIGVYEYEDSGIPGAAVSEKDLRTNLYIPVSAAKSLNGSDSGYRSITIQTHAGGGRSSFHAAGSKLF
jgi:putative ABC transport system permease protein